MRPLAVLAIFLASCATTATRVPIRLAIVDIESKESLGGSSLATAVREHLQDSLARVDGFEVAERKRLGSVVERQEPSTGGRIAAVDWIVYGVLTPEDGGAHLHLRFVRTDTAVIAYSRSRSLPGTDAPALCTAAQAAVAEMVREFESSVPR